MLYSTILLRYYSLLYYYLTLLFSYSTILYSTILLRYYSTILYSTILYSSILLLYYSLIFFTLLFFTLLFSCAIILYSTILLLYYSLTLLFSYATILLFFTLLFSYSSILLLCYSLALLFLTLRSRWYIGSLSTKLPWIIHGYNTAVHRWNPDFLCQKSPVKFRISDRWCLFTQPLSSHAVHRYASNSPAPRVMPWWVGLQAPCHPFKTDCATCDDSHSEVI